MTQPDRIYLDNAATSWPKPDSVYAAVDHYQRKLGGPAGRSFYREAAEVERKIDQARRAVAVLLGVDQPNRIVFTANGTDSLNLAMHGILRSGDHAITSVVEHNSVLRPLRFVEENHGVKVTRVGCDGRGVVDPDAIARAIGHRTKMIVLVHASNVTGALQPVSEVGKIAREHGVLFLVDAAQSLGHRPVDAKQLGADLLAAPGHKGLLGPLGTGILYIGPRVEEQMMSVRQGGTGTESQQDRQPDSLPDKYEAGNHNVPGIVGLGASLIYLHNQEPDAIARHNAQLTGRLLDGLSDISGVAIHGPADASKQVGVVSITLSDYDPQEAAGMLDAAYRIQVRPGLQCAPLMHQSLGTAAGGGTVRFSLGSFTTDRQIDTAISAVSELASTAVGVSRQASKS